jgi:hypothetical protein
MIHSLMTLPSGIEKVQVARKAFKDASSAD